MPEVAAAELPVRLQPVLPLAEALGGGNGRLERPFPVDWREQWQGFLQVPKSSDQSCPAPIVAL